MAPFSFFNAVASAPPTVMISAGFKPDGSLRDTRANLTDREYFVIHIPSPTHLSAVNESAQPLPATESEVDLLDLPITDFVDFPLPRLADCSVALACKYTQHIEIGEDRQAAIFGRVMFMYVVDNAIETLDGHKFVIDPLKIDPVVRLGPRLYADIASPLRYPTQD